LCAKINIVNILAGGIAMLEKIDSCDI